jgi:hypothetical protein
MKPTDPWAPMPGFEPYERPPDDKFDPLDRKAVDLGNFLCCEDEELRELLRRSIRPSKTVQGPITLPNGAWALLTEKADGWELAVNVKRDWFTVYKAPTRDDVLRLAIGDSGVQHE